MGTLTQSPAPPARTGRSPGRPRRNSPAARRTTITLSPEALEIVERYRSATGTSTSAAIDQIIQSIEPKPVRLKKLNGLLVLNVPPDPNAAHFTIEDIKDAEDEMDREYVERLLHRERRPAPEGREAGRRQ